MNGVPKPDRQRKEIIVFAVVATSLLVGSEVIFQLEKATPLEIQVTGTSTSSYSPSIGLQFILNLTNTTITVGQKEGMNIEVYNPSGLMRSVSFGTNYSIQNLTNFMPGMYMPIDFAIYNGNYTLNEVKNANHLEILPPVSLPLGKIPTSFLFQPHSSKAEEFHDSQPDGSTVFNGSLNVGGYWTHNLAKFSPFQPGAYTVVAADGWGQVLLLHFNVKPAH